MPYRSPATQASLYDQRRTIHGGLDQEESKRRKMLRWLKKTVGIKDHHDPRDIYHHTHHGHHHPLRAVPRMSLESYAASHHSGATGPSRKHSYTSQNSYTGTNVTSGFDYDRDVPVYYIGAEPELSSSATSLHSGSHFGHPAAAHGGGVGMASSSLSSTTSSSSHLSHAQDAASMYEFHHRMPRKKSSLHDRYSLPNDQPHVLIIGGGIGGLCLAQGLKKNGIPFTVFERDPTPNYRTQGYRLRINSSGYEALRNNLSQENFEVFLRSVGYYQPGFSYIDAESGGAAPANVKYAHRSNVTKHVFSTDRAMLRSLLLSDLVDGHDIQYGMAFQKFQILPNGRVEVQFENGHVFEGSVLVGADGTTSRVRRQYIPRHVTLLDTDSGAIYGKTLITPDMEQYFATAKSTMVTGQHPKMALVMEPRCASKEYLQDFVASTGGIHNPANSELPDLHNYLCWVLIARADIFHVREGMTVHDLYAMSPEEVAELSIEITSSWCPRLRALLEQQDPEWASFLRLSSMSPDIKAWQPSVVTLLGDAVHTMTPAGIGCNTAMQDAHLLVEMFRDFGVNVDAIAQYEHVMRQHGRDGINTSIEAGMRMYGLPHAHEMRVVTY